MIKKLDEETKESIISMLEDDDDLLDDLFGDDSYEEEDDDDDEIEEVEINEKNINNISDNDDNDSNLNESKNNEIFMTNSKNKKELIEEFMNDNETDDENIDDSKFDYEKDVISDKSILIEEKTATIDDIKNNQIDKTSFLSVKEMIDNLNLRESQREAVSTLFSENIYSFRGIFVGEDGTRKNYILKQIPAILYKLGKIKSENDVVMCSFINMPDEFEDNKFYIINDLSTAVHNLFNLDDFSDEASHRQFLYKEKLQTLIAASKNNYIILNATPDNIKGFMLLDVRLPYMFDNQVVFHDLTNEELYEIFAKKIPDNKKKHLTDEFKDFFLKYIEKNRRFFPFNNLELANYLSDYVSRRENFILPDEKYNDKTLEDSFSTIIGMQNVKDKIYELKQYLEIRRKLEKAGHKLPDFNMHMMFLGSPGTGKTTVARIISKLLFDLGYIRENKLIEVTSSDLVGTYTGMKTNRAIMQAMGGVLFIDEAYSLSESCGTQGQEVIATLIKSMEDYKGDLVVMFAGYSFEMKRFTESNSGILSRIGYIFKIEDYKVNELYDIFKLKLKLAGLTLDEENAKDRVMNIITNCSRINNSGNGRFVDKLLQQTLTKHALQSFDNEKDITIINSKSIPKVDEVVKSMQY